MVDAPDNNFDPQQPVVPVSEEPSGNFFTSTVGKIVLAVIALVVTLAIVVTAIWFFMFSSPSPETTATVYKGTTTAASTASSGTTGSAEAAPITDPQQKPLESTFTFRNVFAPTLKKPTDPATVASITAVAKAKSDSDDGSSSNTSITVPANTLYLVSIQTVDGEKTATFIWNGASYTLGEGDPISGTPWKVVEIGNSSVVMLYGDTQVTLTTGQGLSK